MCQDAFATLRDCQQERFAPLGAVPRLFRLLVGRPGLVKDLRQAAWL